MYTLAIRLYAFAVALVSLFNPKARAMRRGQRRTYDILREKIDPCAKYVWFHASSLGEFEQGRPIMEAIRREHPEYKILLTFFSPSGYEVRKDYDGADVVCYLPFDTPRRVRRFLRLANPSVAIFIKYEFWSNYLHALCRMGVPVYIVSAIFRREQVFFRWYGRSYRKVLRCFTHLFVQDDRSAALLAEYGIRNVTVAGDTRFDRVLDVQSMARRLPIVERFVGGEEGEKTPVLVAGSSWQQDEDIYIPYFNEHPEMKLIIAPHEIHREHLEYIESLLKRPSVRLSAVERDASQLEGKDCLIVDGFGLLSSIYRYGTIAYIGGGFGAGIHNTPEAAVYGIPVLFGPRYHKFKEACDLISVGGGFAFSSREAFAGKMDELLSSHTALEAAGASAGSFVLSHAGATRKVLHEINL